MQIDSKGLFLVTGKPKGWTVTVFDIFLTIMLDTDKGNGYNFRSGVMERVKKGRAVKYNRNVYQALTMITQFGINMLVPIFLCSFAGMFLDRKFGTSFWMILLFFVGTLAGFTNVFRFARRIYETPAVTRRRSTRPVNMTKGREEGHTEEMLQEENQVAVWMDGSEARHEE